jgi:hypothetical protein
MRRSALRLAVFLALVRVSALEGAVTPTPVPDGARRAPDFTVFANGVEVPVLDTDVAGIAAFAADGPVDVVVRPTDDVKRVDLRPMSRSITPRIEANTLRFRLDRPGPISVELNGETKRVLYLFFDPPEGEAPAAGAPGVRAFGPGIHDAGEIRLGSGETLYIPAGAIVRGTVVAKDAASVRILGRGILASPGQDHQRGHLVHFERCRDVLVEGVTLLDSQSWTVVAVHSEGVTLRRVKLVGWQFGSDGLDVVSSSRVRVVDSFFRDNDDCIALKAMPIGPDPWSIPDPAPDVTDVVVERSVFWNMAWGNALEIGFELRSPVVRGVVFRDLDVIHTEHGAVLSIHNGDTATVGDVLYEDIRVEDARHKLIDVAIFVSQYSVDRPKDPAEIERRYLHGAWDGVQRVESQDRARHAPFRGHVRGIVFKDVRVVDGPSPFSILQGYDDDHAVEDVTIQGLSFCGKPVDDAAEGRFFIQNARGVRFLRGDRPMP